MNSRIRRFVLPAVAVGMCFAVIASGQDTLRGGWPDADWAYMYEARHADGDPDGTGIIGSRDGFSDLDASWNHNDIDADNVTRYNWDGEDLITDDLYPGGAEMMVRTGLGDNEGGDDTATDAEVLAILDIGWPSFNNLIEFERFLTDASLLPPDDPGYDNTGAGSPGIDFSTGATLSARFRFFSIDAIAADEQLQQDLQIPVIDVADLGTGVEVTEWNEYDESPRESMGNPKGMFMLTRGDVFDTGLGFNGFGGVYFGVGEDGDDSWDPANQAQPPSSPAPVDVRVAYILGGPSSANFPFQGSGDARLIDQLAARGMQVTVLDDNGAEGHQYYQSTDAGYTGPDGPEAVAHDHDLVVISSTVASNDVGNEYAYRNLGVPFVCWENGLVAKGYAWMQNPATAGTVIGAIGAPIDSIEIEDNTHPITQGLDLGTQQVFYTPQRVSSTVDGWAGNLAADGVTVLARGSVDGVFFLGCLCVADPTSGNLGDGAPATARQVFFFFEDESAAAMSANGHLLFHRAVEWALGDAKAALLAPMPGPPSAPPVETIPSFYVNLGASPAIEAAGLPFSTRVLKGSFIRDVASADPTVPALGVDTRVWAPLPANTMGEFLSVYMTIEPEAGAQTPIGRYRMKVYFDGSTEPVIEVQDHHLDPDLIPAIDGAANNGTGFSMGLWRVRRGGYLDADYFGFADEAVPLAAAGQPIFTGIVRDPTGVTVHWEGAGADPLTIRSFAQPGGTPAEETVIPDPVGTTSWTDTGASESAAKVYDGVQ